MSKFHALKKSITGIIMLFIILTVMPVAVFAKDSDISNHWAKNVIEKWVNNGYAQGYEDGSFKPDNPISRAEFFSLVNNAFGFKEASVVEYKDVSPNNWYYDVIARGNAAGYLTGYADGTIKPNGLISRQEAASVIARINKLEMTQAGLTYKDAQQISQWAAGSIGAVAKAGYMNGYPDGNFRPGKNITRAEAITALNSVLYPEPKEIVFDQSGVYGDEKSITTVDKDVVIKADGVKLQNYLVNGNLTVAEEVGQGTVTLTNVTVSGSSFIRGGGPDSIIITGGQYKNIVIQNVNGRVHVVAKGVIGADGKPVDILIGEEADGNEVILEGEFESVTIATGNMVVSTIGSTKIGSVTVDDEVTGVSLNLAKGTLIEDLTGPSGVEVKGSGTVTNKELGSSSGGGGGGGGGSGSAVNHAPDVPFTPQPSSAAIDVLLSPTLSWICSDEDQDALTYQIYFGTEESKVASGDGSVLKEESITQHTYTPGILAGETTYYWKVVAKDGQGGVTPGPIWSFTTKRPEVKTDASGYFKIENEDKSKIIEGYVTMSRGGSGALGAVVEYPKSIFDAPADLMVTLEGHASTRVQDARWKKASQDSVVEEVYAWSDLDYIYQIPIRELFNPNGAVLPPSVNLTGLQAGDVLTGTVEFDIDFASETDMEIFYVNIGGEIRYPRESMGQASSSITLNTTSYINENTYLKVLGYDKNGNALLFVTPITINNGAVGGDTPGSVTQFNLLSFTYGKNNEYYSLPKDRLLLNDSEDEAEIMGNDLAEEDMTIYCELIWQAVPGAEGYKVYRSFDEVNYQRIGLVKDSSKINGWINCQDFSPLLNVGRKTYYKIVPYSSVGDSVEEVMVRAITPLPGMRLILDAPENEGRDVVLDPEFSWHMDSLGGDYEKPIYGDVTQVFSFSLYDATSYQIYGKEIEYEQIPDNLTYSLVYPGELEPGGIYSWDIYNAYAYTMEQNADGIISAYSSPAYNIMDGYFAGSDNGENIFTTTIEIGGEIGLAADAFLDYQDSDYNKERILVKTKDIDALAKTLESNNSVTLQEWQDIGWTMVDVPKDETVESFIQKLLQDPNVIMAQPDFLLEIPETKLADQKEQIMALTEADKEETVEVGADVEIDELWGLNNIHAEEAWSETTGSENVILAIIDTGVQMDHPEFAGKTFIDPYDATGANNPTIDVDGHGTHVAGIAGDDGRSGEIAGIAWDSPIMPVRVMDSKYHIYTSYLMEATRHVGEYVKNNADKRVVINMSIGGRGYNFAFKDAIDYALEQGVVFVTSAGNDGKRMPQYPSTYNGVISVAASTPYNRKADFSTEGSWNSVAAPGVSIYSTYPDPDENYVYMDGTSMASPYVAGAAALLLSKYPDLTPVEVKSQLEQTAQGADFTEDLGYGVIDLNAMLGEIQPSNYGTIKVKTNIQDLEDDTYVGYGVISIFDQDQKLVSYGTTGEGGSHIFNFLKEGRYTLRFAYYNLFDDEYQFKDCDVELARGVTAEVEITAHLPKFIEKQSVLENVYDGSEHNGSWSYSYEFTLSEGEEGLYDFTTSFYKEDCDTVLYLYDGVGNEIGYNDDFNDLYSLIRKNLSAGDYRVVIEEFNRKNPLYCTFSIEKLILHYED